MTLKYILSLLFKACTKWWISIVIFRKAIRHRTEGLTYLPKEIHVLYLNYILKLKYGL